ncbi:hypothetical protein BB559_001140 [Furculomyces boomerangus]|uniref:Major facilitator superfamily (MFS) profile domain-containing protein n=1 Tax=Furculomyces boomerangus TaxID=61424 RepID=A0A2T9Z2V6_9FUNG|nr:hypothetical protein BB559_001140 [Furculomyces boomerangus]
MSENAVSNNKPEKIVLETQEPPRDKGYAWVVLVCSTINAVFARGSFTAFGVFQTYYLKVMFANERAENVAWIATCTVSMILGGGIFASKIVRRLGIRKTNLLASFIALTGMVGASFCTEIWQLALTQGVIFGFGSSIIVNVYMSTLTMWFDKHRSVAISISSSGSVLGGIILIPLVNKLIAVASIQWAFRVYGMMFFVCTGICGILMKPRIPYKPLDKIVDFKLLKDPVALPLSLGGFFMEIGVYTMILYFPSSMIDNTGTSRELATSLFMIYNLSSVVGRLVSGFLSKRFDPSLIVAIGHITSAALMMGMWFGTKSFAVYVSFMVIFGIIAAPYFALSPVIAASNFNIETVAHVNGLAYLFNGAALFSSIPTIGVVYQKLGHRSSYQQIIAIAAASYVVSTGCMVYILYASKKRKSKADNNEVQF